MVGEISKIILETKFKLNHETKSKTLEDIVTEKMLCIKNDK